MAITPRIEIKQSQSLLMTPQLRQAINLLQMSNLELNELVEKELESNPILERESDKVNDTEIASQTIDDYKDLSTPEIEDFSPDIDYDNQFDDYGSDRENFESDSDFSWQDYSSNKMHNGDEDYDFFEKKLKDDKSLYLFIEEQISLNFYKTQDKIIARNLAEHLDESGYFRGDIKTIATRLALPVQKIDDTLKQMKGFEPSGIFAQSLAECLTIQLQDKNRFDPKIAKLLDNLELLGERRFKELKKVCNCDDEDLADMIDDIKSLNPKPTAEYSHDVTSYVIPDVFVKTNKHGEYYIELNSMSLPRLLINHQYYSEIKDSSNKDKEAKRYLKEQLSNASFLVRAMHQRATTILRVSEEIVKSQREFFEKGIDYLKPMSLKNVAEEVEMHESTISRVTNNKYMHTPRGLFELKYFFSNAAGSYTGDENTSTLSIKHKIKKLIEEEQEDNILSDDKIVELLAQKGIKIARRTITKYRESMNIPSSASRKRSKRTSG